MLDPTSAFSVQYGNFQKRQIGSGFGGHSLAYWSGWWNVIDREQGVVVELVPLRIAKMAEMVARPLMQGEFRACLLASCGAYISRVMLTVMWHASVMMVIGRGGIFTGMIMAIVLEPVLHDGTGLTN